MKKVTKTFSLLILIVTMLLLAACSSTSNNNMDVAVTTNNNTSGASEEIEEQFTIRLVSGDVNVDWDKMQSEVGKAIHEKTGVIVEVDYSVDGSDADLFAWMVEQDEYPDLVMPKGNTHKLVEVGALVDLRPLLEEHAPNLMKIYGEYLDRLDYSATDDSIYTLPLDGVGHINYEATGGFQLQHGLLETLGYPVIRTVNDYESAIKTYLEQHPQTEDGQPRIGLSLNGGESQFLTSVTNAAFYATGAPNDGEFYVNPESYEAMLHYQRVEEREYFRWLNQMNDTGLLDPESFTQTNDQYQAKVASGRVLGLIDQVWNDQEAENVWRADEGMDSTYARFPVTLDETYKDASFQGTGYIVGDGIGITMDANDPVRIIKYLDYLASDEGQVLINWGIEGVHYTVDDDGKRSIPVEVQDRKANDASNFRKETGIGNYWMSAHYGDGVLDPSGNYYTTNFSDQIIAGYSVVDKKTLAAYGANTYKDLWPDESEFTDRPYGAGWTINFDIESEASNIFQKTQDLVRNYIPRAILADPVDFDIIYDEFLAELDRAGVSIMTDEYSKLIKDRIEMWSN